jgi:two-component system KDP operon response regulator KdpE
MDGQHVLRRLREWLTAPIIILSVRDQDAQKIAALDHGADDYLTKPFSTGELLARMRVAMRNMLRGPNMADSTIFECHDLKVDLSTRRVFLKGEDVHLTRIEYKILMALLDHAGKVLTHPYLLKKVWGTKQLDNPQLLRVFMAGLRRKIEVDPSRPRHLLTEQGVGYRLAID